MSLSQGSIGFDSLKVNGAPFPSNAAENGLSVDSVTGRIVLGQNEGAAGNPARLLSRREIPTDGFRFDIGDINNVGNELRLMMDDANQEFRISLNTGRKIQILENTATSVQQYIFGDADLLQRGLQLQLVSSAGPSNRALITALAGDMLDLDQGNRVYIMGDVGVNFSGTRLTVNDNAGIREIRAEGANPFAVQGSTTLIRSYTTLSNAAAAAVGTLNNAPVAGDPTKWISINDNGTVRRIPCW